MEGEAMTRTTGATDDQITAAKTNGVRAEAGIPENESLSRAPLWLINRISDHVDHVAPYLVRPNDRIVAVDDLKVLLYLATSFRQDYKDHLQQAIDRITALIGDEA